MIAFRQKKNHKSYSIGYRQLKYDLCWAVHAESNALLRASWSDLRGATLYITGKPCPGCSKLIASSGINRVVIPK